MKSKVTKKEIGSEDNSSLTLYESEFKSFFATGGYFSEHNFFGRFLNIFLKDNSADGKYLDKIGTLYNFFKEYAGEENLPKISEFTIDAEEDKFGSVILNGLLNKENRQSGFIIGADIGFLSNVQSTLRQNARKSGEIAGKYSESPESSKFKRIANFFKEHSGQIWFIIKLAIEEITHSKFP